MQEYSESFKRKLVQRMLMPGGPSANALGREVGIGTRRSFATRARGRSCRRSPTAGSTSHLSPRSIACSTRKGRCSTGSALGHELRASPRSTSRGPQSLMLGHHLPAQLRARSFLCHRVYRAAFARTPRRWNQQTRNWTPIGAVALNPNWSTDSGDNFLETARSLIVDRSQLMRSQLCALFQHGVQDRHTRRGAVAAAEGQPPPQHSDQRHSPKDARGCTARRRWVTCVGGLTG